MNDHKSTVFQSLLIKYQFSYMYIAQSWNMTFQTITDSYERVFKMLFFKYC